MIPEQLLQSLAYYLVPLALTVLAEGALAAFFRFKKEEQRVLFLINLLTNPLLNLALSIAAMLRGTDAPLLLVLCFEVLVTVSEGFLLRHLLPERRRPFLLSLLFNAASYLFGVVFFALFPVF